MGTTVLSGSARRALVIVWVVVALFGLLTFAVGVYAMFLWDTVPANQTASIFSGLTTEDVRQHALFQDEVLRSGLSLPVFGDIFTVARLVGELPLFLLSF